MSLLIRVSNAQSLVEFFYKKMGLQVQMRKWQDINFWMKKERVFDLLLPRIFTISLHMIIKLADDIYLYYANVNTQFWHHVTLTTRPDLLDSLTERSTDPTAVRMTDE